MTTEASENYNTVFLCNPSRDLREGGGFIVVKIQRCQIQSRSRDLITCSGGIASFYIGVSAFYVLRGKIVHFTVLR